MELFLLSIELGYSLELQMPKKETERYNIVSYIKVTRSDRVGSKEGL